MTQNTVAQGTRWAKCGALLLANTPGGQCPRCLLSLAKGDDEAPPSGGGLTGSTQPQPEEKFGDYELSELIGYGGMGKVYRARQISLNRTVALKMLHAGRFAGPEEVSRFKREAEAAASLDHHNIVHIYEVGQHGEQHYFTMKFVEGQTLAQKSAECRVRSAEWIRESAKLVATVARALHHASTLSTTITPWLRR
jgi:serine/threonine-protein kinase